MLEGKLYKVKPDIHVYKGNRAGPNREYRVLAGYRELGSYDTSNIPPFIYLGHKEEDWKYHYQHTNKIHYIMLDGDIWVMDNQFAKHIIPIWDGEEDGQDG